MLLFWLVRSSTVKTELPIRINWKDMRASVQSGERKTTDEMANDGKECGNYAFHIALNRLGEGMFEDEYIDFKFSGAQMRIEEAKTT